MNKNLLVLGLALAACGRATSPSYHGEPLATVTGQLTLPSGRTITSPVHLALAWYPNIPNDNSDAPSSRPRSIVTEEVLYQGTFPLSYSFAIYTLPPEDALTELSGAWGSAKVGIGVLIAYADDNGNELLDTIPPGRGPVDTVLGNSLGPLRIPGHEAYFIIYLDGDRPSDAPPALAQGFNMVNAAGDVVPFSTLVPIDLTASPDFNVLVCEEAWRGTDPDFNPCIPPLDQQPPPPRLRVSGSLGVVSNGSAANLSVNDGDRDLATATVTVNGRDIPYDSGTRQYSAFEFTTPFLRDGDTNELRVAADGFSDLVLSVVLAGNFQLSEPAFNANITSGAAFTVSWTASAHARDYRVTIYNADFDPIYQATAAGLSLSVPGIAYTGSASVNVEAKMDDITEGGSFLLRYTNQGTPVRFVP